MYVPMLVLSHVYNKHARRAVCTKQVIDPAVAGTRNVLAAVVKARSAAAAAADPCGAAAPTPPQRVVLTSSAVAVSEDARRMSHADTDASGKTTAHSRLLRQNNVLDLKQSNGRT